MDLLLQNRKGTPPRGLPVFQHFAGEAHKHFQIFILAFPWFLPGRDEPLMYRPCGSRDRGGERIQGGPEPLRFDELPVEGRQNAQAEAEDTRDQVEEFRRDEEAAYDEVTPEETAEICQEPPDTGEECKHEGHEGDEEEEDEPEEDIHLEEFVGNMGEGMTEDEIPEELPDEGNRVSTRWCSVLDDDP